MKLSDIKGEAALDALADLIDPVSEIISDKEFVMLARTNAPRTKLIKAAIKNNKKAVIQALAILDGKNPDEFEVNILTLPSKLIEILNDPAVSELFSLQGQTGTSSGSATENIEVKEN